MQRGLCISQWGQPTPILDRLKKFSGKSLFLAMERYSTPQVLQAQPEALRLLHLPTNSLSHHQTGTDVLFRYLQAPK